MTHDYEVALENWKDVLRRLPHFKASILLGTCLAVEESLATMARIQKENLVIVPRVIPTPHQEFEYPDNLYIKITEHLGDLAICEAYYSPDDETIAYERKK